MNGWISASASMPVVLTAIALMPTRWSNRHPRLMTIGLELLLWIALVSALFTAVTYGLGTDRTPIQRSIGGAFGPAIYFDTLTATLLLLVCFVGTVVVRYSRHYLDGDAAQGRFAKWLAVTIGSVLGVIVSGNLLWFTVAWMLTSLSLHQLLTFYPSRPGALLAARKKFVISRLGDACLIAAMVCAYHAFGTLEFHTLFGQVATPGETDAGPIAVLLIVAAILKSAQFPFHSWLPDVMETPTPVSALMHAGIINAGGFLIVRMSPVITLSPGALSALALVGAITALYGSLVMLTQTSIKRALAYSTIAQMGFMMLQCGLGAFSAAVLHIVAHSLYKAHAFLSAGSVIDLARASWVQSAPREQSVRPLLVAFASALAICLATALGFGVSPAQEPGVLVLGAILVLAISFLVWKSAGSHPDLKTLARSCLLAAFVCTVYFMLQSGAAIWLQSSLPMRRMPDGPFDLALASGVIALFAAMLLMQSRLPGRIDSAFWQKLYVHSYNGFYISVIANRLIERLWPLPTTSARSTL